MQKKNKSSPKDNQNILVTILLALSVFEIQVFFELWASDIY